MNFKFSPDHQFWRNHKKFMLTKMLLVRKIGGLIDIDGIIMVTSSCPNKIQSSERYICNEHDTTDNGN